MVSNPQPGQQVRLHYAKHYAGLMPYHRKQGTVVMAGRARPRNHLVKINQGPLVVVPAGNLQPVLQDERREQLSLEF